MQNESDEVNASAIRLSNFKNNFNAEKTILTSEGHAKHPFAGINTQQS